jgi:hypothetical protein
LVEKPEGRRPFGRPRHRWEDNITMDLWELLWGHGLHRSGSGQGQGVGCCDCGNEPSGFVKCREFLD